MSPPAVLFSALQAAIALGLCPLLPAVVNRTKALVAGRRGQPLLSFEGDLFPFAYLFGLMRFPTMLAALDTGSAFEGMGASREAWYGALSEPALLVVLILANLWLLGSSRLFSYILAVAAQGVLVAALPFVAGLQQEAPLWRLLLQAGVSLAVKGFVFPWLFMRAARSAGVRREVQPFIGYTLFLLLLVGYDTKMGLAPLHTWLPDAHSEAPSAVSALLSGALLNCAFLALLRVQSVCAAAYSLLLAVAFVGMVPVFVRMSFGRAASDGGVTGAVTGPIPGGTLPVGGLTRDIGSATLASLLLLACSAALGVWLPPALGRVLGEAVGLLGVRP